MTESPNRQRKKNRHRRSRDELRQLIVEAGCHLFAQDGYAAITIRQVAHAADVPLPTLYKFFSEKRELYEQCCKISARRHFERLASTPRTDLSGEASLYLTLQDGIEMNLHRSEDYLLLNRVLFEGEFDIIADEVAAYAATPSFISMSKVFEQGGKGDMPLLRMALLDRFFGQLSIAYQVWPSLFSPEGKLVRNVLGILLPHVDWDRVEDELTAHGLLPTN